MEITIDVRKNPNGTLNLYIGEHGSSGCEYTCPPELFGAVMQRYLDTQSSALNEKDDDDPKYIACEIMFKDDSRATAMIIKSDEVVDEYDEQIFFYGKTLAELKEAEENKTLMENEWYVLQVLDWSNDIEELIF